MAQVDGVGEVMDVIEVVTDKQLHKVGDEVTWQVTKEVRDMGTGRWGSSIFGRCALLGKSSLSQSLQPSLRLF